LQIQNWKIDQETAENYWRDVGLKLQCSRSWFWTCWTLYLGNGAR